MKIIKKISVIIFFTMILLGIIYPYIVPYDIYSFNFEPMLKPQLKHLLGTDEMGRDIFSMLLYGFRITIFISIIAGFLSTIIGGMLGIAAAYYNGYGDNIIVKLTDIFIIIPEIVMILFFATFSSPKVENTILAIAFFSWSKVARIIRTRAMIVMSMDKVRYTMLIKGNLKDIILKMWREVKPAITTMFILQSSKAAVYESTLSFFGIGDPLIKTWGRLIKSALNCENIFDSGAYLWYLMPP
ncbi:MAG: ABC transporter permease, partial [Solirubrobacterales bacterium]